MKDISILMLTHNAPDYVKETIETLNTVTRKEDLDRCELIVWDNASEEPTIKVLEELRAKGFIDKLHLSKENLLFAGGNNAASKLADNNCKYYLLLNSDIKIKDKNWLKYLIDAKVNGNYAGVSYGFCKNPNRCDGYCLLLDRALYDKYQLDENFQWWWGVTKLQAQILKEGHNLLAYSRHNHLIYHYGGKSGGDFKTAKGMDTNIENVIHWFNNSKGKVQNKNAIYLWNPLKYFNSLT